MDPLYQWASFWVGGARGGTWPRWLLKYYFFVPSFLPRQFFLRIEPEPSWWPANNLNQYNKKTDGSASRCHWWIEKDIVYKNSIIWKLTKLDEIFIGVSLVRRCLRKILILISWKASTENIQFFHLPLRILCQFGLISLQFDINDFVVLCEQLKFQ